MSPVEAIEFMKKNKIVALRLPDGLEMTLAPQAFDDEAPKVEPDPKDGPDLDKIGITGMTRRQQIELFGRAIETDFPQRG